MWPWEHAAVGYLLYSLSLRALGREPPSDAETAVLLVATQVPDLVDKPLSWGLGVFQTGYALGHSAFVAVPVGLVVLAVGRRVGHTRAGIAVVVGYWSHLLGDILSPIRSGEPILPGRVLWPVVDTVPYDTDFGLGRGLVYLQDFVVGLSGTDPLEILVMYALLPFLTLGIWVLDGAPGTTFLRREIASWRGRTGE